MFAKLAAVVWLLVAVLPILAAGENYLQDPKKCGQPVCKDDNKFAYAANTIYSYKYGAKVSTQLDAAEANANASVLHIDAEFQLKFLTPCQAILQITSAALSDDPDRSEESGEYWGGRFGNSDDENSLQFNDALTQYPLRFYMESGTISEICPDDDEKVWTLNFKRGLLSSFQNTMTRLDRNHRAIERDVNGECVTRYRLEHVNGTTLVVSKEKQMRDCMKRYSLQSVLPMPEYVFQSKYHQHWTPLESTVKCEQSVDHRVMTSLECREMHSFEPLRMAREHRLVRTTTAHLYTLINEEAFTSYAHLNADTKIVNRRETLLYQHERPSKTDKKNLQLAENHIRNLCEMDADSNNFRMELADELRRVVYSMRQLDEECLQRLALRADDICTTGRKHLLQAVPYVQTQASIRVMKDILMSDADLSVISTSHWLFTMALFPRPDARVLQSMTELAMSGRHGAEARLAASAVLHSYCGGAKSCHLTGDVAELIAVCEQEARLACAGDVTANVSQALTSLKALGNAAVVTPTLLSTLGHCITSRPQTEHRLRIAAIEAHRRLSCDIDRNHLLAVYLDQTEDAQLRIAAYIQVMQCPTYTTVKSVIKALHHEQVNQVGSFVWSHLSNLAKSAMPARVMVQALLQDEELAAKFSSDLRCYSQNLETSVYINQYGLGGFLSGNVIYSPKSYVPRTVMLNFTAFLFGEPVNLIEVTVDLEGCEQLIEKWFRGGVPPLLSPSFASFFSSSSSSSSPFSSFSSPFNLFRFARSLSKDLIAQLPDFISENFKNTKASIGVKVFGHELAYFAVENRQQLNALLETVDPLRIVKDFLSGQEMKVDRMSMLVDSTYVAPLSVGLPLHLGMTASAAIKLTLAGFVNTTTFTSHGHLDIQGKLRPSVALSAIARMSADAFYGRTEARLEGRLLSSSALEGSLSVKGKTYVRLSFDLPMHKADLISAQTRLVISRGGSVDHYHQGVTNSPPPLEECTWPLLDEMLALRMCSKVQMPQPTNQLIAAPLLLLKQPLHFALSLEKSDPSATRYTFLYTVHEQPAENRTLMSAVFETPGSLINRTVRAEVAYTEHLYNISLLVQSKNNRLSAQGRYVRLPLDRSLVFGLDINGKKHVDIEVSLKSTQGKYGYTHQPKLDLQINGKSVAHLDGTLKWVDKKGIAQCDVALNFRTQRFEATAHGYMRVNEASFAANIALDYQFTVASVSAPSNHQQRQQLRVEVKLGDRSTKRVQRVFGGLQLESTAYPNINLILNLKLLRAQEHVEYIADLQTNPPASGGVASPDLRRLSAQASYASFRTFAGYKTSTFVELRKPDVGLDLKLGYAHEQRLHTDSNHVIVVRYAQGKEITVALDLKMPPGSMFYFEGQLKINLPAAHHPFIVAALIHEKSRNEYDLDLSGAWFSGHNMTIRGHYSDRCTPAVTSHTLKLLLSAPLLLDSDWSLATRLYATDQQRKLDIQAAQGVSHSGQTQGSAAVYELRLENQYEPLVSLEIGAEIRLNSRLYTMLTHIDLAERRLALDLHLDRARDVRVDASAWRNQSSMLIGAAVRWDANRDPTRFVALDLKTTTSTAVVALPGGPSGNYEDAVVQSGGASGNQYDAQLSVEYPGRRLDGVLTFTSVESEFRGSGKVSWSQRDAIDTNVYLKFDPANTGVVLFNSEILTPFEMWERTSFTYGLWLDGGKVRCNATLDWMRSEWCAFDLQAGYQLTNQLTQVGLEASLNSSSPDVSQLLLKATHAQSSNRYDTLFVIQSSSSHQMRVWSGAELNSGVGGATAVVGGIRLNTPFAALQRGHVEYTLKVQPAHWVSGHFSFNVNDKTYSANFKGVMRSLYEAGITAELTTPYAAYSVLRAQAGYSTLKRRLLAEVRREGGASGVGGVVSGGGGVASGGGGVATGFEVICRLDDVYDFNVKVHLYTGFTVATDLLLVANIDPEHVDMRCGWNGATVGVAGVAHITTDRKLWYTDVDYSAMLYLPVEHYARTGAAVRLKYNDRLDLLARLEAADKKLGVKVQAMVWPEDSFARMTSSVITSSSPLPSSPSSSSSSSSTVFVASLMAGEDIFSQLHDIIESREVDENDRLVIWRGVIEVDTVVYNTSAAILELDRLKMEENRRDRYNVNAGLHLPFIAVQLTDSLLIQNLVNMSNVLIMTSTHNWLKQATVVYEASGQLVTASNSGQASKRFAASLNASLLTTQPTPLNLTLAVNYTFLANVGGGAISLSPLGVGSHHLWLDARTPLASLDHCLIDASYSLDASSLGTRLLVDINQSMVDVAGSLVTDAGANFVNSTFSLQIKSPHFVLPVCQVGLEKDFTQVEKRMKGFVVLPPTQLNSTNRRYEATAGWHLSTDFVQLDGELHTPSPALSELRAQLRYHRDKMAAEHHLDANAHYLQDTRMRLTAHLIEAERRVEVAVTSSVDGLREVRLKGRMLPADNDTSATGVQRFEAELGESGDLRLEGWLTMKPTRLEMRLVQKQDGSLKPGEGELASVSVRFSSVENRSVEFAALIQQLDDKVDISGDLETLADQSKRFKLKTTTTYKGYEGVEVGGRLASRDVTDTTLQPHDTGTTLQRHSHDSKATRHELMVEGETRTEWLETQFKWQCIAELGAMAKGDLSRGLLETDLKATQLTANGQLSWLWMWITDVRLKGVASYAYKDVVKKDLHTEISMWNPKPSLSNTTLFTDISFNDRSWWLSTNASLIKPTNHSVSISVDLLPPQNQTREIYSVVGKMAYQPDYTAFSHLLRYSTSSSQTRYETLSEVALADTSKTAQLIFRDASLQNSTNFYFNDSFVSEKTRDDSKIYNILSTSLLAADLETNLTYHTRKRVENGDNLTSKSGEGTGTGTNLTSQNYLTAGKTSTNPTAKNLPTVHEINCQIFYPQPRTILDAFVKFQDVNNFQAKVNSSTPFRNVSHISAVVRAETGDLLLHRYGEVLWSNTSAYLNYVHNVKWEKDVKILNGLADVVFPLATKHYATLLYKIDNIERNGKLYANGTSTLLYNNSSLILANFTRQDLLGNLSNMRAIYDVRLINSELPLNFKYYHTHRSWRNGENGDDLEGNNEVLVGKIGEDGEVLEGEIGRNDEVLRGNRGQNGGYSLGGTDGENGGRINEVSAGKIGGNGEVLAGKIRGNGEVLAGKIGGNGEVLAGKFGGNGVGEIELDDFVESRDTKQVVVWKDGEAARNFSGVFEVTRYHDNQKRHYKMAAKHTTRDVAVDLWLKRQRRFETSGSFVLKPELWFRYGLVGENKDRVGEDGRRFELDLAYPERSLGVQGEYKLIQRLFQAGVQVKSNRTGKREKRFGGKLSWKTFKMAAGKHSVQLLLDHPQFEQPVKLQANVSHNDSRWFDMRASASYSVDRRRTLALDGWLDNLSTGLKRWYMLVARVRHPATRLSLAMDGSLSSDENVGVLEATKNISYKRSYLPLQYWNASLLLDRPARHLVLRRESLRDLAEMAIKYQRLLPGVYRVNSTVVKGKDLHLVGDWLLNVAQRDTSASVNVSSADGLQHRLRMVAWYRDRRHLHARAWREEEGSKVTSREDVMTMDARLNHSRMLTASARWRKDIRAHVTNNVQVAWDYVWTYASQTVEFWSEYMRSEALETCADVWRDAKPLLQDFVADVADVRNFTNDFDYFKRNVDEAFEANEFYLRDAYNVYLSMIEEMSFQDRVGSLPKIVAELWQVLGETGETIRQSLVWTIESVRVSYEKLSAVVMRVARGDVMTSLSQFLSKVTAKYDRVVKDLHISLMSSLDRLWRDSGEWLHLHWSRALQYAEPTVIRLVHYVDSMAWEQSRRIFELFDRSQAELLQSDYFAKNTNLTRDLERLYKNLTSNTLAANIQMYSSYMLGVLNDKLVVQVPFGRELTEVGGEIYGEVLELGKLPLVNATIQTARQFGHKMADIYRALDVEQRMRQALPALYRRATELASSALDNEMSNHKPKTLFLFSPEKGFIILEQKLPMPWHAFNETPNFQEIPEYKRIVNMQRWFNPTNTSLWWTAYHSYLPLLDSTNWLPPFRAHAIILTNQLRLVSWNGRGLAMTSSSSHAIGRCTAHALLAADFVDRDFQLIFTTLNDNRRQVVLIAGGSAVTVDMTRQTVSVTSGGGGGRQMSSSPNSNSTGGVVSGGSSGGGVASGGRRLPIDVGAMAVVQERGVATVTGKRGFQLQCAFQHGVCVFTLEGWYYGKTAGLLGTMDSEWSNDLTTADGQLTADAATFVDSWLLGGGTHDMCHVPPTHSSAHNMGPGGATPAQRQAKCAALFASKESELSRCYNVVGPDFYHRSCLGQSSDAADDWHDADDDAYCAAALAYSQACQLAHTPIKVPATCVRCRFSEGTELSEADAPVELTGASMPQSSDVVLVVEAGACTRALNSRKQLQQMAAAVDDELTRVHLVRNRFAVVSYGGLGLYAEPRLMTVDGMDFTTARLLHEHLAHLPSEAGPRPDVFDALRFTFSLQYRAGVSRTLIVVLCSDCSPQNTSLDFSTLRQMMADRSITLHLLMDHEFSVEKARAVKTLYGIDADKAYTKNDFKQLQGDADLRKQVKLSKTTLGNCLPLAIETNGTIFTARKLDTSGGAQNVRKFLNVFARRVAASAQPLPCQRCECVSDAGGVAYYGGGGTMGIAYGGGGGAYGGMGGAYGGVGGEMGVPSFDCYSCDTPSPFAGAGSSSPLSSFHSVSNFGFRNNFTETFLQSLSSDGEDMDFEDGI